MAKSALAHLRMLLQQTNRFLSSQFISFHFISFHFISFHLISSHLLPLFSNIRAPTLVLHKKGISQIAAGRYHSSAITPFGALYTWGCGENGQLVGVIPQIPQIPQINQINHS